MSLDSPPDDSPKTDGAVVARLVVAGRSLLPVAFEHLTDDVLTTLPYYAQGPSKALLKGFFSAKSWTHDDTHRLAEAVGPGEGWWSRPLDDEVTLDYGWRHGRFSIAVSSAASAPADPAEPVEDPAPENADDPVVAEATDDPRTVRFRVGSTEDADSAWSDSPASAQGYWRAARLFDEFPEVADVVIGEDFVEVSFRRASDRDRLLGHVSAAVARVFERAAPIVEPRWMLDPLTAGDSPPRATGIRRAARLANAWAEMRQLRPADARDLEALITASHAEDPLRRQVAVTLLLEADPAVAHKHWERLLADRSLAVRRAVADALANAARDELRPLLERALGDGDGWVRQRAVQGLMELGPEPSREALVALARDPDFRVRLEIAELLRPSGPAT